MKTIVCIVGPTASGKSAAVLALSQNWPIEIINVDSATIYTGMDIGTAKPSMAERALTPQHLLDIRDPAQTYSVADFRQDALRLIQEIQGRGRIPILAGGTMMYFKALREGLHDLPAADSELRESLNQLAQEIGWPAMHQRLAAVDPETAARLAPNDSQRVQRALEVYESSGKPMSAWHAVPSTPDHPYTFLTISLEPEDRAALHQRIEARFDQMLADGFVEEVAGLKARPDLHADLPSMRCVGYRQIWDYLDGKVTLEQARLNGIAATRQLAKRQITWLRNQPDRIQIDGTQADAQEKIKDAVRPYMMVDNTES